MAERMKLHKGINLKKRIVKMETVDIGMWYYISCLAKAVWGHSIISKQHR